MRLTRLAAALAVALASSLALAAAPRAVMAQAVTFSGSGTVLQPFAGLTTGAYSFSFTLPQSPTPSFTSPQSFLLVPVTGAFTQGTVTTSLTGTLGFYTVAPGLGGFQFLLPAMPVFNESGPQLFSGTTAAPTFLLGAGTTDRFDDRGPVAARVSNYAIASTSTVPEPSMWALLGTGLLAVGGVAARRKRATG
jgi:hypothetical protein